MDNITHSLIGVALADAVMGRSAAKSQRPLIAGAGLVAANLPDIDLAYSAITPAPIGYLVHHRGHSHPAVGLLALAVALVLAYRWVPAVRAMRGGTRARFWLLILIALASHLAMDALNSYGAHPWYPFDNRWRYGDAVFIFEPSLWLLVGVAVVWNGRSNGSRLFAAVPMVVLLAAMGVLGIVPLESLAAMALVGGCFMWIARRLSPVNRARLALAAAVLVMGVLTIVSREARAEAREVLQPQLGGRLVDVILTPNPSAPHCWGVIAIDAIEKRGEYVLWQGTLSLAPWLRKPAACPSHQFTGAGETQIIGNGRFAMRGEIRQSLARLRDLAASDCWVAAWLRFGRAPVIDGGQIFDLRFGDRGARAFTHMPLVREAGAPACPRLVPAWGMPRRDLLGK